jgi:hypothetical protein
METNLWLEMAKGTIKSVGGIWDIELSQVIIPSKQVLQISLQ